MVVAPIAYTRLAPVSMHGSSKRFRELVIDIIMVQALDLPSLLEDLCGYYRSAKLFNYSCSSYRIRVSFQLYLMTDRKFVWDAWIRTVTHHKSKKTAPTCGNEP